MVCPPARGQPPQPSSELLRRSTHLYDDPLPVRRPVQVQVLTVFLYRRRRAREVREDRRRLQSSAKHVDSSMHLARDA